jgi:hypothetical protein
VPIPTAYPGNWPEIARARLGTAPNTLHTAQHTALHCTKTKRSLPTAQSRALHSAPADHSARRTMAHSLHCTALHYPHTGRHCTALHCPHTALHRAWPTSITEGNPENLNAAPPSIPSPGAAVHYCTALRPFCIPSAGETPATGHCPPRLISPGTRAAALPFGLQRRPPPRPAAELLRMDGSPCTDFPPCAASLSACLN